MATVSLCMIVKDEEEVLARCLGSAKDVVDEIIIVDTGSTDATKEIAAQFTDKIYDFEWIEDFAAARNFSFSKATMDYILWLDADDVLEGDNPKRLAALIKTLDPATMDMIMIHYDVEFDAQGNAAASFYRERLVRREKGYRWINAVHEGIPPSGSVIYADGLAVSHRKVKPREIGRNLRIMRAAEERGDMPTDMNYYYGRELLANKEYLKSATILSAYIDNPAAWPTFKIDACRCLSSSLAKLGERDEAYAALFRSFSYNTPRAEVCCAIATLFMEDNKLDCAVFWLEAAKTIQPNSGFGECVIADCYDYIPNLYLAQCYERMGKLQLAHEANELAGTFKPDSPLVEKMRKRLEERKGEIQASGKGESAQATGGKVVVKA